MEEPIVISKIQLWENEIRQGRFASVRSELQQLPTAKIPRSQMAPLASIGFRVGLPYWSLKLLGPLLRSEKPVHPAASDEEKLAYAAALLRVGVIQEAFDLLKQIDSEKHPGVFLQQAFGNFKLWKYEESIPTLKKFLRRTSPENYQYIVGQVNLVAAFIYIEDFTSAEVLALEILRTTTERNYFLLHGNALELLSQIRIFQGNYDDANNYLDLSEKRLSSSAGSYSFFVKKWKIIAQWLRESPSKNTLQNLNLLRDEAIQFKHWETLRECDYYEALKTKNQAVLDRLSFGTPFSGYRRRMKEFFGSAVKVKGLYMWQLAGDGIAESVIVDPHAARQVMNRAHSELSPGLRKTMKALCKDFYRPLPQGEFFAEVFPDEYFNPFTSPSRLELVVRRLRNWFIENNVPLQIEVDNKEYRLIATAPCSIAVYRRQKEKTKYELMLADLESEMQHRSFKVAEACLALDISESTVHKVLKAGLAKKKLYKSDRGPACRYHFHK